MQKETAIILHQGLSMSLEMEMQDPKNYRITRMTKTGKQPYQGIVIAKSGIAYQASCDIQSMMNERFALPCELDLITTTTIPTGDK